MKIEINDVISLIEQNFNFLHLGKFLSWYIRKNNLADVAETIPIRSDDGEYILYGNRTKMLLEDAFINGYKSNILGYFTEWNAFRGIFMAVREGIDKVDTWKSYLEERLGEQYDFFEKIIKFARNVLSHNIHHEIRLHEKDIFSIKKWFENKKLLSYSLNISYKRYLPEASCHPNYSFKIELDYSKLKDGEKFLNIISLNNLYMLADFCYNLADFYNASDSYNEVKEKERKRC